MEQYKDFWISGSANPGPPYMQYWHASGSICYQRPDSSVVELARFTLNFFKFDDRGVGGCVYRQIAWAKLRAPRDGAAVASKKLWS